MPAEIYSRHFQLHKAKKSFRQLDTTQYPLDSFQNDGADRGEVILFGRPYL